MTLGHIKQGHIAPRKGHVLSGFTLIELLVVIAIIGILSSVVLASLNTARNRGADAAIKSNLANARAEAELYYDTNNSSYNTGGAGANVGVCASSGTNVIGDNIAGATSAGSGAVACYASATAWAATAQLKTNTGQYYCVDSTGYAAVSSSNGPGDYACP
jgi:prepilin-type N-terminal cleavage/methylation domain-containing protein